jgi:putative ABC transport system permease protein
MSILLRLARKSLWNRRATVALTVASLAVSVALLVGVAHLRSAARQSFANTISGTDLIVGARTGPLNLLLFAVFHAGEASQNISYAVYQKVAHHPDVEFAIPLALGDSHRGYRVLGTEPVYFEHWRTGQHQPLRFAAGKVFTELHEAVLGAEVAARLGYHLGQTLVIAHGLGTTSFAEHADQPFTVSGILAPTGTPVDRTVHVSLEAISAIHADFHPGHRALPAAAAPPPSDLAPPGLSAFAVGMKSRSTVFVMQRALNDYRDEPLLAIIPAVALTDLWQLVGVADTALLLVAACVVLAGLFGMLTAILTSLGERRREMAILRSVGARPRDVFVLLTLEAGLVAGAGVVLGTVLMYAALALALPLLAERVGFVMEIGALTAYDACLLGGVIAAGLLAGALPAWRAYRHSLADGLTIRL